MVTGVLDSDGVSVFKTLSRDYYKTIVMTVSERENEAIKQVQRAGAVAIALAAGTSALVRWGTRWGSTPEERARALPGDGYTGDGSAARVSMTVDEALALAIEHGHRGALVGEQIAFE